MEPISTVPRLEFRDGKGFTCDYSRKQIECDMPKPHAVLCSTNGDTSLTTPYLLRFAAPHLPLACIPNSKESDTPVNKRMPRIFSIFSASSTLDSFVHCPMSPELRNSAMIPNCCSPCSSIFGICWLVEAVLRSTCMRSLLVGFQPFTAKRSHEPTF